MTICLSMMIGVNNNDDSFDRLYVYYMTGYKERSFKALDNAYASLSSSSSSSSAYALCIKPDRLHNAIPDGLKCSH